VKKQGAIILGIGEMRTQTIALSIRVQRAHHARTALAPPAQPGGDNSDSAIGTFFEGCITSGYSTDAVDIDVFENVKQAGYGGK
jgi:hypothetical protein